MIVVHDQFTAPVSGDVIIEALVHELLLCPIVTLAQHDGSIGLIAGTWQQR
jgi:hypothetical protein